METSYLIKDISTAYEGIQKMLQYNFNAINYENISKWIKETWFLIQQKRDEYMKEKNLYSKFETERNKIEKELDKEMKDKSSPDYQQKKTEELNKRMQAIIDPYMQEFIDTAIVKWSEYKELSYTFQDTVPAYVNMFMEQNNCVAFKY